MLDARKITNQHLLQRLDNGISVLEGLGLAAEVTSDVLQVC